ncbi:F420H(2)-dependent quinone reductase [Mycobacterium kubicae]|uniref:F420H(2)-dependent quinone reductase n=1 Tax=Mycobacterium kubicae TaxID=120959 RepID=A0AAX1J667_9MYCO|nr:nitroreductase family deazaflavin-dependent oxidoreductase [Mycobacterium kubicae]MCV7096489.1 nitroreductase family deazaflavin-dependent oxidoreductase [Mycobacterium kubicae]OBF20876.1 nitroreductase [Mycobacterium kubicae]ORW01863.1 nitroreductase [Mycobacterium kubicae]QNI08103.1 nitroreductase family deazaflavin-dependent oxidoreductase [Mycobacterium kubicae]QNI13161.1 nitroreductase family deazaflavin-dependent oxidoreductase [Mycobacterium kubicae]
MSNLNRFEQWVGIPLLRLHDTLYQKTNGRVGHKFPGVPPSLLLHTVGAKTGQPRTTSLTYARDGDAYLIVASNGGDDRYPGWYHNLRKHPDCEINVGPQRLAVRARRVTAEDADYARLWQVVNKNNFDRYSNYQRRTSRPIPIFALTPR